MMHRKMDRMAAALAAAVCMASAGAVPAPAAPGTAQNDPAAQEQSQAGQPSQAAFPDEEIAALVLASDANEIHAAQQAAQKKMGADAAHFAKVLLRQHRADSNQVARLARRQNIVPDTQAARVQQLRAKGEASLQSLSGKDSLAYEHAFINAMIQDHSDALSLLDGHLIPSAENPRLRKQLRHTRSVVADHLEQAKRLQGARASR
jgi:putative membrane protein